MLIVKRLDVSKWKMQMALPPTTRKTMRTPFGLMVLLKSADFAGFVPLFCCCTSHTHKLTIPLLCISTMTMMKSILLTLPVAAVGFTIQTPVRSIRSNTQLDAGVGVFFGTSTGNTETAAEMIASAFESGEPIDIDTIQGSLAAEFAKYDALVVGTPTWNTGT
jgi:hypothetical protein